MTVVVCPQCGHETLVPLTAPRVWKTRCRGCATQTEWNFDHDMTEDDQT